MKDTLTQKQENYTQLLFKGVEQNKAWGDAGFSTNYSMEVLAVNASRLANSTKVKLRLGELRGAVASVNIMKVTERQERLSEIARANVILLKRDSDVEADVRFTDNIRAIAELNKMDGDYAPERKQIDLNLEVNFVIGKGYVELPEGDNVQRQRDSED